jgi:hypothetical protein
MSTKARARWWKSAARKTGTASSRFPRLFQGHESIPGLTWPTTTFSERMTVYLGKRRVDLMHLGRAHTAGDIVVMGAGRGSHVHRRHRRIPLRLLLRRRSFQRLGRYARHDPRFDPQAIAPGRGDALVGREMVNAAIESTDDFVDSTYRPVARVAARGGTLKEAWDAVRENATRSSRTTRSTSIACRSTSPAPLTRRAASTRRASGPRNAMRKMWAQLQG